LTLNMLCPGLHGIGNVLLPFSYLILRQRITPDKLRLCWGANQQLYQA